MVGGVGRGEAATTPRDAEAAPTQAGVRGADASAATTTASPSSSSSSSTSRACACSSTVGASDARGESGGGGGVTRTTRTVVVVEPLVLHVSSAENPAGSANPVCSRTSRAMPCSTQSSSTSRALHAQTQRGGRACTGGWVCGWGWSSSSRAALASTNGGRSLPPLLLGLAASAHAPARLCALSQHRHGRGRPARGPRRLLDARPLQPKQRLGLHLGGVEAQAGKVGQRLGRPACAGAKSGGRGRGHEVWRAERRAWRRRGPSAGGGGGVGRPPHSPASMSVRAVVTWDSSRCVRPLSLAARPPEGVAAAAAAAAERGACGGGPATPRLTAGGARGASGATACFGWASCAKRGMPVAAGAAGLTAAGGGAGAAAPANCRRCAAATGGGATARLGRAAAATAAPLAGGGSEVLVGGRAAGAAPAVGAGRAVDAGLMAGQEHSTAPRRLVLVTAGVARNADGVRGCSSGAVRRGASEGGGQLLGLRATATAQDGKRIMGYDD